MDKVGILGGTFDPIHYGHLFIAENARHCFELDKVIFIPTGKPPHKSLLNVTDKAHRYAMACLAVKGNPHFEVSGIEVSKDEVCYAVDTMTALKDMMPDADFYYIVGADSLYDMVHWKNFKRLAKLFKVVSINRMTSKFVDVEEYIKTITEKYGFEVRTLEMPIIEVSSTEIRRRVKESLPVKYMLPESVERYIKKNKLYR